MTGAVIVALVGLLLGVAGADEPRRGWASAPGWLAPALRSGSHRARC
jgi:hypothetical protein